MLFTAGLRERSGLFLAGPLCCLLTFDWRASALGGNVTKRGERKCTRQQRSIWRGNCRWHFADLKKKEKKRRLFDLRQLWEVEEEKWERLQVVETLTLPLSPPAWTRGLNVLGGNNWPTTRKWPHLYIWAPYERRARSQRKSRLPARRLHSLNLTARRHGFNKERCSRLCTQSDPCYLLKWMCFRDLYLDTYWNLLIMSFLHGLTWSVLLAGGWSFAALD